MAQRISRGPSALCRPGTPARLDQPVRPRRRAARALPRLHGPAHAGRVDWPAKAIQARAPIYHRHRGARGRGAARADVLRKERRMEQALDSEGRIGQR